MLYKYSTHSLKHRYCTKLTIIYFNILCINCALSTVLGLYKAIIQILTTPLTCACNLYPPARANVMLMYAAARSTEAPEGINTNNRGCKPTADALSDPRPRRGRILDLKQLFTHHCSRDSSFRFAPFGMTADQAFLEDVAASPPHPPPSKGEMSFRDPTPKIGA